MDEIKKTMAELAIYGRDRGVGISIEALPSRCRHPVELVKDILSCSEDLSFTMDFEYAAAYNMFNELLVLSERLSNVHLRDYNGYWVVNGRRSYLRPGQGELDFEGLIRRIRATGYDNGYTIEAPYDDIKDLNNAIERFRYLV